MKLGRIILIIAAVTAINGCVYAPQSATPAAGSAVGAMAGSGVTGAVASAVLQNPTLVSILMQQLGITSAQAMGGAGSIFSLAQSMMSANNFGLISQAVPNMGEMLAAAPKVAPVAGGALQGTSLGNVANLATSFKSLGMESGMVNKFIPVVLQYLQDQGGSSTMSLMQKAILP